MRFSTTCPWNSLVASVVLLVPLTLLTSASFNLACASDYHVDPLGNDANDGRAVAPLKTIAAASARLTPGDTCIIHAGTYHETIKPLHSGTAAQPITYCAAPGGRVILSAAQEITGWTLDHDAVYRAAMAWDLGAGCNQIFVDGAMMVEARFPHVPWHDHGGFDLLHAPLAKATALAKSAVLNIPELTQADNFWADATVWGEIGDKWTAQVAHIDSSTNGAITVSHKSHPWYPDDNAIFGNAGGVYLSGTLAALAAPGEWFFRAGTLYLMTTDGKPPSAHIVEARTGRKIADLAGCSWIVLKNLHGYAGTMAVTGTNCTVQGCSLHYVSQEAPAGYSGRGGMQIDGSDNVVTQCLIDGSSSNGISLGGTGNRVTSCLVRNVDSIGDYSAAVAMSGSGNVLERCTLTNSGRALIIPAGTRQTIRGNDLSYAMQLTQDGGALYAWGVDSQGTEICFNRFHDCLPRAGEPAPIVGIYIDDGCKNFLIHHNAVWNCRDGMRLGHAHPTSGQHVYNNTLWANEHGMMTHGSDPFTDIRVWNNLSDHADFLGTDLQANLTVSADAFVAPAEHNFLLSPHSPAIKAGKAVPGIAPGDASGACDAGAYPLGQAPWPVGVPTEVLATLTAE